MAKDWISLEEAAEIVGVHPSTIRLWSDKGILPVYRTPGGHRRYRRADVELWVEHVRRDRLQPEAILQSAVRNVRVRIAEGQLQAEGWYQKLDEECASILPKRPPLFQGLMSYLASMHIPRRLRRTPLGSITLHAHRSNLSYVEAAQAFLFFRNTLIESVIHAYREANVPFDEVLRRMHIFTDEILVSLLQTYQQMEQAPTYIFSRSISCKTSPWEARVGRRSNHVAQQTISQANIDQMGIKMRHRHCLWRMKYRLYQFAGTATVGCGTSSG